MFALPKKPAIFLAFSIFVAHFFAGLGQSLGPFKIIFLSGYSFALITGTVATFGCLYLVTWISNILAKRFPWKLQFTRRVFAQLSLGIVFPFIFVFLIITLYYATRGIWILDTGWMEYCSPYVVIGLVFVNIAIEDMSLRPHINVITLQNIDKPIALILEVEKKFKGRPFSELIYINAHKRSNHAMFPDGILHRFHYTITAALKMMPVATHMRLSRWVVVELASIIRARYVEPGRKKIRIFLAGHEEIIIIASESVSRTQKNRLKPYIDME